MLNLLENNLGRILRNRLSRRELIRAGLITTGIALVPRAVLASIDASPPPPKVLSLYNVYTQESLDTTYWKDGQYIPEALSEVNHIFRDRRSDKEINISTELMDLLFDIQNKLQSAEPFQIISGYRTPKTNALLRRIRRGVARNSLHMFGQAVDIRLDGYNLEDIRHAAISCQAGGVGYYPRSGFVHVDVGLIRYWRG